MVSIFYAHKSRQYRPRMLQEFFRAAVALRSLVVRSRRAGWPGTPARNPSIGNAERVRCVQFASL